MRTLSHPDASFARSQSGDWRNASRCLTEPPDDFFPIGHGPAAQRQISRAKRICHACPVRMQCLSWALTNHIGDGVFGGLDPDERKQLVARRGDA
jgi:WhiB family redox-sensing transcriptional regulator